MIYTLQMTDMKSISSSDFDIEEWDRAAINAMEKGEFTYYKDDIPTEDHAAILKDHRSKTNAMYKSIDPDTKCISQPEQWVGRHVGDDMIKVNLEDSMKPYVEDDDEIGHIVYLMDSEDIDSIRYLMDSSELGDCAYRYSDSWVFFMDIVTDCKYRVYFTISRNLCRMGDMNEFPKCIDIMSYDTDEVIGVDYHECRGWKCRVAVWDQDGKYDREWNDYGTDLPYSCEYLNHCLSCYGEVDASAVGGLIRESICLCDVPVENVLLIQKLE